MENDLVQLADQLARRALAVRLGRAPSLAQHDVLKQAGARLLLKTAEGEGDYWSRIKNFLGGTHDWEGAAIPEGSPRPGIALRNALIGAAGAGGLGLLASQFRDEEERHPAQSAMSGAMLGALLGGGGTAALEYLKGLGSPSGGPETRAPVVPVDKITRDPTHAGKFTGVYPGQEEEFTRLTELERAADEAIKYQRDHPMKSWALDTAGNYFNPVSNWNGYSSLVTTFPGLLGLDAAVTGAKAWWMQGRDPAVLHRWLATPEGAALASVKAPSVDADTIKFLREQSTRQLHQALRSGELTRPVGVGDLVASIKQRELEVDKEIKALERTGKVKGLNPQETKHLDGLRLEASRLERIRKLPVAQQEALVSSWQSPAGATALKPLPGMQNAALQDTANQHLANVPLKPRQIPSGQLKELSRTAWESRHHLGPSSQPATPDTALRYGSGRFVPGLLGGRTVETKPWWGRRLGGRAALLYGPALAFQAWRSLPQGDVEAQAAQNAPTTAGQMLRQFQTRGLEFTEQQARLGRVVEPGSGDLSSAAYGSLVRGQRKALETARAQATSTGDARPAAIGPNKTLLDWATRRRGELKLPGAKP